MIRSPAPALRPGRYLLVLALACLSVAASARTVRQMTEADAQLLMFPQATAVQDVPRPVITQAVRELQKDFEVTLVAANFVVRRMQAGDTDAGWFVTDQVIGKFEKIDYAVALDAAGNVMRVEILRYRESHGHEVAERGWLARFEGATATSPLKVGKDIDGISGATLSAVHVSEGVRRITRLVAALRRQDASGVPVR